uniref:Glycosyltransferase n=1 Tax=Linum usitatissimum TaxID=4006 RepID=I2BH38_LINUS|nr:UDP-glycosyltransferase 1 [Linum usitatissimum]
MFIPFLAPGHMLPMVDIARLFAANGVNVTILTTTTNARLISSAIDHDARSGLHISLLTLRFPGKEAGLPEGCENLISAPTPEINFKLFHGIKLLQPEMEKIIRAHNPDCLASDYLFPWSADIASDLGIPRLAFSGSGFFNLCIADSIESNNPHRRIQSETEEFVVPGIPDLVKLTRSQLPDMVKGKTEFSGFFDTLKQAERKSYGVLMNSFQGLESDYADHFKQFIGLKAWQLGPVSLFVNRINLDVDKFNSGGKAAADVITGDKFLNWLDSEKPNSVLYFCLGSLTRFTKTQISEIATALEESNHPFIWVVAKILKGDVDEDKEEKEEWWLPQGFEERVVGKGMIIKGWVPQTMILEHASIGGFVTHCGWNSIMEGVCGGVPMVTWPIFAEQFYNEKLVTQVLKLGVSVGNQVWSVWATEESPLIKAEKIKSAIDIVMGQGPQAIEMRKKIQKLAEMAKNAVEIGGSSDCDLKSLLNDIRDYKKRKHNRPLNGYVDEV